MPLNADDKHVMEPQDKFDYSHYRENEANA